MESLELSFNTAEEFIQAVEQQFSHEGCFVPGDAEVQPFSNVTLVLSFAFAGKDQKLELAASVLQIMPGAGVALKLDDENLLEIRRAAGRVRAGAPPVEPQPEDETDQEDSSADAGEEISESEELDDELKELAGKDEPEEEDEGPDAVDRQVGFGSDPRRLQKIRRLPSRKKLILALRGDRVARGVLINDSNNSVHLYLLKNPRITINEVQKMAGSPKLNPALLKMIAENQEYKKNHGIIKALVRNYKTPTPIALKLLESLGRNELKEISRLSTVRKPVQEKAKLLVKKML